MQNDKSETAEFDITDLIGPEISKSADDDEWSAAVESWDNAEADEDFWGTGTDDKTPDSPSSSKERTVPVPSNVAGGKQELNAQESSKCNNDFMESKSPTTVSNRDKNLQCEHSSFYHVPDVTGDDEKCSTAEQSNCVPNSEENVDRVAMEDNQPTSVSQLCVKETKNKDSQNEHEKEIKETDPLCLSEEEHGELFVMEDSDSEGEGGKRKWKEPQWRPVVKEDPYFVKEFLHLSLEEVSLLNLILLPLHQFNVVDTCFQKLYLYMYVKKLGKFIDLYSYLNFVFAEFLLGLWAWLLKSL